MQTIEEQALATDPNAPKDIQNYHINVTMGQDGTTYSYYLKSPADLMMDATSNCMKCGVELGGYKVVVYKPQPAGSTDRSEPDRVICSICNTLDYWEAYKRNNELTMKVVEDAQLHSYYWKENRQGISSLRAEYQAHYGRPLSLDEITVLKDFEILHEFAQVFEREVWFGKKLNTKYKKSPDRGHLAKLGDIEFRLWGCAGRVMMTIADLITQDQITLLCHEDTEKESMYVRSVDAKAEKAKELLRAVINKWDTMSLNPDSNVSIGI